MNPNRHRAIETRQRGLSDQIDGLERMIATGLAERHHVDRLDHTRRELAGFDRVTLSVTLSADSDPE